MSDLSAKFATLEEQVATQHTETISSIADINTALSFLGTSLDIIIANNATNTRLLLAAIGQTSPCAPCPTPPLSIPDVGTGGIAINPETCQRTQAFLSFMEAVFTVLDVCSTVGIGFNPSLITDAYNQVIASLSGGDSPPVISFPEGVQVVGDLINYVALNITRGATLIDSFTPLYFDLRDAIFLSGSPSAAKAQYVSVINSSSLDSDIKAVLKDAAYNDLFSYFFDPASTPNLTGIDGSACEGQLIDVTSCITLSSVPVSYVGHVTQAIQAPPTAAPNVFYIGGDFFGWTLTIITDDGVHGVDLYRTTDGSNSVFTHGFGGPGSPYTIVDHGLAFAVVCHDADIETGQFSIQFCPPS